MESKTRPGLLTRSTSPTRVNIPVNFAFPISSLNKHNPTRNKKPKPVPNNNNPNNNNNNNNKKKKKKTCSCSPTIHPGSFRCSFHKNNNNNNNNRFSNNNDNDNDNRNSYYYPSRLNARRSAMTNSLVRIGTVEGELVRRALAALIRPSSHTQRRRGDFQARPSRLCFMSRAEEEEKR